MVRELLPPETGLAFEAMRALRPHHADREAWVARVDDLQRPDGYRLVAAFEDDGEAVAVAGFRLGHNLVSGRFIYVDDLSTLPAARGRGHGEQLLRWIFDEAQRLGCDEVQLDSGTVPERWAAHRLYHRVGMSISAHHFTRIAAPTRPKPPAGGGDADGFGVGD
jgi:GNAT superfamily N-acetyltransferase